MNSLREQYERLQSQVLSFTEVLREYTHMLDSAQKTMESGRKRTFGEVQSDKHALISACALFQVLRNESSPVALFAQAILRTERDVMAQGRLKELRTQLKSVFNRPVFAQPYTIRSAADIEKDPIAGTKWKTIKRSFGIDTPQHAFCVHNLLRDDYVPLTQDTALTTWIIHDVQVKIHQALSNVKDTIQIPINLLVRANVLDSGGDFDAWMREAAASKTDDYVPTAQILQPGKSLREVRFIVGILYGHEHFCAFQFDIDQRVLHVMNSLPAIDMSAHAGRLSKLLCLFCERFMPERDIAADTQIAVAHRALSALQSDHECGVYALANLWILICHRAPVAVHSPNWGVLAAKWVGRAILAV